MKRFSPCLLSALLFALAHPSFPHLHLEFLEWVWMVPLLLALRDARGWGGVLWRVTPTVFLGWALVMSWLLWATIAGSVLLFFVGAFVYTMPLVAFHFLHQRLGWRVALWSLPLVWTGWEWLYHQTPGAIAWLSLGLPQSRLWWLIQFADVTGQWGVTFWVVLVNVAIADCGLRPKPLNADRGKFPNDAVPCLGNVSWKFAIRNSQSAICLLLIFGLPLGYSTFRWLEHTRTESDELSLLLVQPNINPWTKAGPETRDAELRRLLAMTNRALRRQVDSADSAKSAAPPDLILWPEVAIPFPLTQDHQTRALVARNVAHWQTPLLAGAYDLRQYADPDDRPPLLKFQNRHSELFNAAFLLTPNADGVAISAPYHKQKLMPFVEQVPFAERWPALSNWMVDFGASNAIDPGIESNLFALPTRTGRRAVIAAVICYEQFFPAHLAGLVRRGGEMIAVLSNVGWFSQSHGQHQIAAFLRMRAIESHRNIVCAANTGQTTVIDPLGRVQAEAVWWSPQTLSSRARLSSTLSFYVRHPDWLPKVCVLLTLALLLAALGARLVAGIRRSRRVAYSPFDFQQEEL